MGDLEAFIPRKNRISTNSQFRELDKLLRDVLTAINGLPQTAAAAYQVTATAIRLQLDLWKP